VIEFKVPKRWRLGPDLKTLARRIADIVVGHKSALPEEQTTIPQYQGKYYLDRGNDWWMHDRGDGTVLLNYRYGINWPSERWEAFKTVILTLLGEDD
jgi:hypothetical protein